MKCMANVVVKPHTEDKNEFVFCGNIIDRHENASVMVLTLRTAVYAKKRIINNYPRILVFDSKVREKVNSFPLRTPVKLTGYVTSFKEKREENVPQRPSRPPQSFVLTDIEAAEGEEMSTNSIELVGSVDEAFISNGARGKVLNLIVISMHENHYMKRIKMRYYIKESDDISKMIEFMVARTRLKINAHCNTMQIRDDDENLRTIEFIVIDTIEKC